jgi:myo-inositol 2-dehydrogenase/D-chiro-inositol 1-dehydrogenase
MASEKNTIKVALVGTGRIGNAHLRNCLGNPRVQLAYVVDVDEKQVAHWKSQLGNSVKFVANLDDALQDSSVDAVIVCTPTATHRDIIVKSVRAKKAVMCEKPISLNIDEIDECYKEAKENGVPLLCGYQRRSDPSFVKLQESCRSGQVGTLQIVKTISRDNPVPSIAYLKISGGIFHDCGSHDIDLCRWILNEDPVEVFSFASAFRPEIKEIGDYDTILVTMKYASGALASIDLSRKAAYGYDQRIEVLGEKGMVQANNKQPTTFTLCNDGGITTDPFCYSFPQRYEHAYALELDHFVDVVLRGVTPRLSHEDARKVAIVANAAEESARTGKKVILKWD